MNTQEQLASYNFDNTFCVELDSEPIELTGCPKTGTFTVYIYPKIHGGPSTQFNISNTGNTGNQFGSITRLTSIKCVTSEQQIDMRWMDNCSPEIFFKPYKGYKTEFIVRVLGVRVPVLFCGY